LAPCLRDVDILNRQVYRAALNHCVQASQEAQDKLSAREAETHKLHTRALEVTQFLMHDAQKAQGEVKQAMCTDAACPVIKVHLKQPSTAPAAGLVHCIRFVMRLAQCSHHDLQLVRHTSLSCCLRLCACCLIPPLLLQRSWTGWRRLWLRHAQTHTSSRPSSWRRWVQGKLAALTEILD
jgi:hypothetical protein